MKKTAGKKLAEKKSEQKTGFADANPNFAKQETRTEQATGFLRANPHLKELK